MQYYLLFQSTWQKLFPEEVQISRKKSSSILKIQNTFLSGRVYVYDVVMVVVEEGGGGVVGSVKQILSYVCMSTQYFSLLT